MYNYIYLTLVIHMKNANDPCWSYSFAWLRIFIMQWFLSGNVHSSKWNCTAEITWFDQRLKAKQAIFWHPSSWAAGLLGRPPLSWQELKSLAHTGCQCPAWKSSTLLLPRVRDHAVHQWEVSETSFTCTVWWCLFLIPTQSEIVRDLPFSG